MSERREELRERAERAGEELRRLRDELGVRLHLAGLEAKGLWSSLEPHLARIEARLEEAAAGAARELHDQEAALRLHLALMDARDRLAEVEPALRSLGDRIRAAGAEVAGGIPDPVRLQAKLASMDLEDALQRRRREVERGLREVEAFGGRLVDEIATRLRKLRSGSEEA